MTSARTGQPKPGQLPPTRREFIRRAGIWVGAGLVLPWASPLFTGTAGTCLAGEAETRPAPPPAIGRIAQLSYDASACAGCGTCELVCAMVHSQASGPDLTRIWVQRAPFAGYTEINACHQCHDPKCYYACPVGALYVDQRTGARCIDPDKCVGCRRCYHACPFDPPRINFDPIRKVSLKCDLCKDRAEGPACVQFCQQMALRFDI